MNGFGRVTQLGSHVSHGREEICRFIESVYRRKTRLHFNSGSGNRQVSARRTGPTGLSKLESRGTRHLRGRGTDVTRDKEHRRPTGRARDEDRRKRSPLSQVIEKRDLFLGSEKRGTIRIRRKSRRNDLRALRHECLFVLHRRNDGQLVQLLHLEILSSVFE